MEFVTLRFVPVGKVVTSMSRLDMNRYSHKEEGLGTGMVKTLFLVKAVLDFVPSIHSYLHLQLGLQKIIFDLHKV